MEVFHRAVVEDRLLQPLAPVAVLTGLGSLQVVLQSEEALSGLELTPVIIEGAEGVKRPAGPGAGSSY